MLTTSVLNQDIASSAYFFNPLVRANNLTFAKYTIATVYIRVIR